MLYLLFSPFLLQALLIIFDEGFYHIRRGLPRWERIGHPVDTFSFVACLCLVQSIPYSTQGLIWFVILTILSCLLITKDEFIHKHHCPASEQWVHAVMFINHPVMLASLGLLWYASSGASHSHLITLAIQDKKVVSLFLKTQTIFTVAFMIYQIIFWNFIWQEKKNK